MARVLSGKVGLPRDIEWKGRTVHTGIWKDPVRGRCRTRRLNLDGDGQGDLAGHGGEQRAVFVFAARSRSATSPLICESCAGSTTSACKDSSPLCVLSENIVLLLHYRVAPEPALGIVGLRRLVRHCCGLER